MINYTTDQYFNILINAKNDYNNLIGLDANGINSNQTLLNNLQSETDVATWVHIMRISAELATLVQGVYQSVITDMQNIITTNGFSGNLQWIQNIALAFQYGDTIKLINNIPTYDTINDANKIIKNCSVQQLDDKVTLKYRGITSDILTTDQQAAFESYIQEVKFPFFYNYLNVPSDKIKLVAKCIINPQASQATIQPLVETAINNYIANISFDSYIYTTYLIDAVKAIPGVFDFWIHDFETRPDSSTAFTPVVDEAVSYAGYFTIDTQFPLSSYITYQNK